MSTISSPDARQRKSLNTHGYARRKRFTSAGSTPFCLALLTILFSGGWSANSAVPQLSETQEVTIEISKTSAELEAGGWVEFTTTLRNNGNSATPPLIAHLSIAVVDTWRHVDPEDWSPDRTQFLQPLAPGESVEVDWEIHALFEGEFTSFVTVMSQQASFEPVTGPPLRLQIAPDDILPMDDVIPVVAVVPLFPLALLVFTFLYARRRRADRTMVKT